MSVRMSRPLPMRNGVSVPWCRTVHMTRRNGATMAHMMMPRVAMVMTGQHDRVQRTRTTTRRRRAWIMHTWYPRSNADMYTGLCPRDKECQYGHQYNRAGGENRLAHTIIKRNGVPILCTPLKKMLTFFIMPCDAGTVRPQSEAPAHGKPDRHRHKPGHPESPLLPKLQSGRKSPNP